MTGFERQVFGEALQKYGKRPQINMVMEEMAELQKELCKHLRGAENVRSIAEEIADVQIMLDQMMLLFDCEQEVGVVRWHKVERLLDRIRGGPVDWIKEEAETCR